MADSRLLIIAVTRSFLHNHSLFSLCFDLTHPRTVDLRFPHVTDVCLYVTQQLSIGALNATVHLRHIERSEFHPTVQEIWLDIGLLKNAKFHGGFKKWIPFLHLFKILYELEKKSSLVTHALSAKSCTHNTDSLHSCTRLHLVQEMACLHHSCKIWPRKHLYPNLIPIIYCKITPLHLHLTVRVNNVSQVFLSGYS